MKKMRIRYCARCVIPSNYPGVSLNSDGVCNLCENFSPPDALKESRVRANIQKQLGCLALDVRRKKKLRYHCAVALSGGKDSTYTTWLLAKRYGLNVLAVTVDQGGFLRPQAKRNAISLARKIGVDHVFIREEDLFRKVYRYAFTHHFFSTKEGLACALCSMLIPSLILKFAQDRGIPYVARGTYSFLNPGFFVDPHQFVIARKNFDPVVYEYLSTHRALLTEQTVGRASKLLPQVIHPLNAMGDYSETNVLRRLSEDAGFSKSRRFVSEKTTCNISIMTMYLFQKAHGYNPYCGDVCTQIRQGLIDKDEFAMKDTLANFIHKPGMKRLVQKSFHALKLF